MQAGGEVVEGGAEFGWVVDSEVAVEAGEDSGDQAEAVGGAAEEDAGGGLFQGGEAVGQAEGDGVGVGVRRGGAGSGGRRRGLRPRVEIAVP